VIFQTLAQPPALSASHRRVDMATGGA